MFRRIQIARENINYFLPEHKPIFSGNMNGKYLEPNCFGTALFLLGVLPYDMVVFSSNNFLEEMLTLLEKIETIEDNSLVLTFNKNNASKKLFHMAYIEKIKPTIVHQRLASRGKFISNEFIDVEDYLKKLNGHFINGNNSTWEHYPYKLSLKKEKESQVWAKRVVDVYSPHWWT